MLTAAWLIRRIFERHGWPLSEAWRLTTHSAEAWPRGRKIDPEGPDPANPILSRADILDLLPIVPRAAAVSLLLRYPREIAAVALTALAFAAFWGWVGERERAAAAQARAEIVQQRLDASLDSLDIERDRTARADSQAVRNLRELFDERAESERAERAAEEAVRLAEQKVSLTLDIIRDNATPAIRQAVNRLEIQLVQERTAYRTLVRSLRSQLVVADSTARLWQTRYAAVESVVSTQDQVIQDYEARLAVELHRNDTSWSGPGGRCPQVCWRVHGGVCPGGEPLIGRVRREYPVD